MNVREWALPVYTILMQMAVGGLFILWVIRSRAGERFTKEEMGRIIQNPILVITVTGFLAMIGAHFHLSKPLLSFMAILNVEHSWLSREILFTVLFFLSTVLLWYLSVYQARQHEFITSLGWAAILFGLIVVYCMANIYIMPTQEVWNSLSMVFSFYATTLLLGCIMIACLMVLDLRFAEIQRSEDVEIHARLIRYSFKGLAYLSLGAVLFEIVLTLLQINTLQEGGATAQASMRLLFELYLPLVILRGSLLIFGAFTLGYYVNRMYRLKSEPKGIMRQVYLASLFIIIAEIIGRFLFYAIHIRVGL